MTAPTSVAAIGVDVSDEIWRWAGETLNGDPVTTTASTLDRLAALEALDDVLAAGRVEIADARARLVAAVAAQMTSRKAALALGISLAAVAKAVARARRPTERQTVASAGGGDD